MRPILLITIVSVFALAFAGCEGDAGPQGPPGPQGPQGPPAVDSEFSFAGKQGEPCQHCHLTIVEQWAVTGHSEATSGLDPEDQDNAYCMQCHTTGWDRPIESFGTVFETVPAGPDTAGYDDYFRVDSELAEERRMDLAGVQCEACHGGMGPDFNSHRPEVSFSTRFETVGSDTVSTSLCAPCHNNQLEEWAVSGHSFYNEETGEMGDIEMFNQEHYIDRSFCNLCHTSEGFIRENDPAYADYDFPEEKSFIGCVTCHDPHQGPNGSGNEAQLRAVGPVEVAYAPLTGPGEPSVPVMENRGTGQTCAQCHHARRDTENVQGQIAEGYAHFGPHSSPQMDMFLGYGSYEIDGYTYTGRYDADPTAHYNGTANACVDCHMAPAEGMNHTPHQFFINDPDNPEWLGCVGCHGTAANSDQLYDGIRTDVETKLNEIAVLLGYADLAAFEAAIDDDNPTWTVQQREAAYAAVFVLSDGSWGVHNPDYTIDLLDNAIDYLTPVKGAGK